MTHTLSGSKVTCAAGIVIFIKVTERIDERSHSDSNKHNYIVERNRIDQDDIPHVTNTMHVVLNTLTIYDDTIEIYRVETRVTKIFS